MGFPKKFKCYCPLTNRWFPDESLVDLLDEAYKEGMDGVHNSESQYNHLIWLQYSSQKDIHGEGIFEDDVLDLWCDSESEKLGKASGEWRVKCVFNERKAKFVLRVLDDRNLEWSFNDTDFNGKPFNYEVIGNISSGDFRDRYGESN